VYLCVPAEIHMFKLPDNQVMLCIYVFLIKYTCVDFHNTRLYIKNGMPGTKMGDPVME